MIVGSVGATIGSALLFTLSATSTSAQWIGYQAFAGLAIGLAIQIPVIAGQAVVMPTDLSSVTAMILFCQTIGGAFFVSAGQSAFTSILLERLPITAPSVDAASVVFIGVTELRNVFSAEVIPGIIKAYMDGLQTAYAIAIASAGIATVVSFASRWRNLKGANVTGAV
jgi:hypothetical protein